MHVLDLRVPSWLPLRGRRTLDQVPEIPSDTTRYSTRVPYATSASLQVMVRAASSERS
jgi:hypothetical protein